jgi:type IV pilus assembly protein PilE
MELWKCHERWFQPLTDGASGMNVKKHDGFTLIELMIVVALIGVLASFGFPAYQDQVRKTRRADCQAVLMEAANALERYYTEQGAYTGATAGTHYPDRCPIDPGTLFYSVATTDLTPTTFELTATVQSAQAKDKCKNLTLTNAGQKGQSGAGLSVQDCW